VRKDPIVEEIHQIRQKLLEKYDGDLEKLMEYLKSCEKEHQAQVVTRDELKKRVAI